MEGRINSLSGIGVHDSSLEPKGAKWSTSGIWSKGVEILKMKPHGC